MDDHKRKCCKLSLYTFSYIILFLLFLINIIALVLTGLSGLCEKAIPCAFVYVYVDCWSSLASFYGLFAWGDAAESLAIWDTGSQSE